MPTKFDARQVISKDALSRITGAADSELDNILRSLNSDVTAPLAMTGTGASRVLSISNILVTNPENTYSRTIPPISNLLPTFASGTVTFSGTGPSVTATPSVGSNLVFSVSSGNFIKIGVNINKTGQLVLTQGVEGASVAAATNPVVANSTFGLGYVVINNVGGVIQNIGPDDIVQYEGGGGSGSGGLAPQSKSASFTAESGVHYLIDTSGGAVTVTLPLGEDGARIRFSDSDNTFVTNTVTINRAGSDTINYAGLNDTQIILDINSSWSEFTWDTANSRWLVDTAFNPAASTFLVPDGSAAGPSFSFLSDTNTGIYRIGSDTLGFATAGVGVGQIGATGAWTLGTAATATTHILNANIIHQKSASTTAASYYRFANSDTTYSAFVGQESSAGGALVIGAAAYSLCVTGVAGVYFSGNNGTNHGSVTTAGAWTLGANTGSGQTHTIRSNGQTEVQLAPTDATAATRSILTFKNGAGTSLGQLLTATTGTDFQISVPNVGGSLQFRNGAGTITGVKTYAGAWTFGASATNEFSHTLNARSVNIPISAGSQPLYQLSLGGTGGTYPSISYNAVPTSVGGDYSRTGTDIATVLGMGAINLGGSAFEFHAFPSGVAGTLTVSATSRIASASVAGAWTFGPTTGSALTHLFRSNSDTTVKIDAPTGSNSYVLLTKNNATKWQIFNLNSNDSLNIYAVGNPVGSIASSGDWVIGSTSLALVNTVASNRASATTGTSPLAIQSSGSASGQYFLECYYSTTTSAGGIQRNALTQAVQLFNTSDRRVKKDFAEYEGQLDKLCQVQLKRFNFKNDPDAHGYGPIAQELALIYPDKVNPSDDGLGENLPENGKPWSIGNDWSYELIKAIQELSAKNDELEQRLALVEGML